MARKVLPTKIKIMGFEYDIVLIKYNDNKILSRGIAAQYDTKKRIIWVRIYKDPNRILSYFLHELFHVIVFESGIDNIMKLSPVQNEMMSTVLATVFFEILKINKLGKYL